MYTIEDLMKDETDFGIFKSNIINGPFHTAFPPEKKMHLERDLVNSSSRNPVDSLASFSTP
jgi:hypothetical protein